MAGEPKNQPPFTNPAGGGGVDTSGIGSAANKGLGITTVRSADDLRGAATSSVDAEINAAVDPLQAQIGGIDASAANASKNISAMFGSIMPYTQESAAAVKGAYDEAEGAQQNIFAAANQRLNQLKQSRAQEAQALAQEMGGPVSLGEFTAGMDDQASLLTSLGAGQQLHTLQYGLADVGEAQAFAGRVMPLVQTEQQAQARSYYENQKKVIQDQITSLKAQRGSKITQEYNDMLAKEREYALQKTQEKLDKLKSDRDWAATKRTLGNDDRRLRLAEAEDKRQTASLTGTLGGKPTLEARRLTAQEKQFAQQQGLSEKEYLLRLKQLNADTKLKGQQLAAANRNTWNQYLDAAVNPQPGKSVTVTMSVPVSAAQAYKNKNAYVDKNSPTGYSALVKTVQTPTNRSITNPTALVDYLVAHNVPKRIAVNMVKTRLRIPDWVYGEGDPNAPTGTGGRSGKDITRPG